MKRLLLLLAVPILLGGCSLYSQGFGSAYLDGLGAKFVLVPSVSQFFVDTYFAACHEAFGCYQNAILSQTNDPVGIAAIEDLSTTWCGTNYCPAGDETAALTGWEFTEPGGFPNQGMHRCLSWNVSIKGIPYNWHASFEANDERDVVFIPGTWSWLRKGNWSC